MITRREAIAHREMEAGEGPLTTREDRGRAWHIAVVTACALICIGVGLLLLSGCASRERNDDLTREQWAAVARCVGQNGCGY